MNGIIVTILAFIPIFISYILWNKYIVDPFLQRFQDKEIDDEKVLEHIKAHKDYIEKQELIEYKRLKRKFKSK